MFVGRRRVGRGGARAGRGAGVPAARGAVPGRAAAPRAALPRAAGEKALTDSSLTSNQALLSICFVLSFRHFGHMFRRLVVIS